LTEHTIQRRFTLNDTDIVDLQLHGFADASSAAYGVVVYICYLHADASVVISLVSSSSFLKNKGCSSEETDNS